MEFQLLEVNISTSDSDDFLSSNHVELFMKTAQDFSFPPVIASCPSSFYSSSTKSMLTHKTLGANILLSGNHFSCNFGIKSDSIRSLFNIDPFLLTMEDWVFLFDNIYPDRSIVLMPTRLM